MTAGDAVGLHPTFSGRWSPEPDPPEGYNRWPTMGYAAAAWIEAMTGLELDGWQIEMLRRVFAYHPDTLDWLHEDLFVVGPEAIGKSAFFAAIDLWLLDGPCMPPVEAPQRYPDPMIPVVSAGLSLTEHQHNYAEGYVSNGPLAGRIKVENSRIFRADAEDPDNARVHFPPGSGEMQQGGNPRPAIVEEELHVGNAQGVKENGVQTIRVYSDKRTKTTGWRAANGDWRPLTVQRLTITNPDDGDPDSLLGQRWSRAEKILDGELVDEKVLVVHFCCELPVDVDDPDDLRRAIRQANPTSWKNVDAIARKYEKGELSIARLMRLSLGHFHGGDSQVVDDGLLEGAQVDVDALGITPLSDDRAPPPPPDVPVALAFDGARNRDTCALVGCTPEGFGFTIDLWEPPEDRDGGWRGHDKEAIHDRVVEAMEVDHPHGVLAVDPTWFEDYAVRGWRNADGQQVLAWVDRWPGRVVIDVQKQGSEAWSGWLKAVRDGEWRFDGDARLLRHMRNARTVRKVRYGREYELLAKKRPTSPIDLLVTHTYAHRLAAQLDEILGSATDLRRWLEAMGVTPQGA